MKVFYNPRMSVDSHGYSPSSSKPAAVVADWQAHNLAIELCDVTPATRDEICLAHHPNFVDDVLGLKRSNGHGNKIAEVTEACRWTVGSMIAAANAAIMDGVACSPTSGFHHAGYGFNGAFCTFNGLIVAARSVINSGTAQKVAILDCDAHIGNGTQDCIDHLKLKSRIMHWDFGSYVDHHQFNAVTFPWQVDAFLRAAKHRGAELLIYQAGADPHRDDPLGGYMTTRQMQYRDHLVFNTCRELGLPIAWNLAGGYQKEADGSIGKVLSLHRTTAVEALKIFQPVKSA